MADSQNRRVLVSCIGRNPASALLTARHFEVQRVVLVGTAQTSAQMQAIEQQTGLPTTLVRFDDAATPIDQVHEGILSAWSLTDDEQVVLDLTGATKLLSMGAWNAVTTLPSDRYQISYLSADGELFDPTSGKHIHHEVAVEIEEVLQWQGAKTDKTEWQGQLSEVDRSIARRSRLAQFLLKGFGRHDIKISPGQNSATIVEGPRPTELPSEFKLSGKQLTTSVDGYFSRNLWLEELCIHAARQVLPDCPITRAAAGLHVTMASAAAQDEVDVALVRGARICVIEAKARGKSDGAGADLGKRISKTREYFGQHAHVVFVHPAWGDNIPPPLKERSRFDATLVGADLRSIKHAVFRALGRKGEAQP